MSNKTTLQENNSLNIKNISLDSVAPGILFFGVMLLPLFFIPALGISIDAGKTVFLIVIVLLSFLSWLFARLKGGSISIPLHPLFAAASGIVLVSIVSAFFSPAIRTSLYGFVYETGTVVSVTILFLLMFLAALFFQTQRSVTRIYQGFLIVFGILFLFQMMHILIGADFLSLGGFLEGRAGNLVGKWNDFGIFAGMITLLSLITLEKVNLKLKGAMKIVLYGVLLLSLLALAVVNFYLAWFIVGLFSLIIFVYSLSSFHFVKDKEKTDSKHVFITPSFVVTVIAFVFLISDGTIGGFINQKLNVSQIEVRPSWASTATVLKETIKDRPLFGSGPNRFTNQWFQFKPEAINNSSFWNAEFRSGVGLLPTFAVTTGVAGAVAWMLFLVLFFYRGAKLLFSSSPLASEYSFFSSFVLAAYLWIISFFYVPNITIFSLAFLSTGIFIGISAGEGQVKKYSLSYFENPRTGFVSILLLVILVAGVIVAGYSLTRQLFALKNFYKARTAFSVTGDLESAEGFINKSIDQNKSDVYYRALAEIKTRQINLLLSRQNISPEAVRAEFQSLLGGGINAGQLASQFDASNYVNWLTLSRVYGSVVPFVTGAYENARITLTEAQSKNPKNPLLLLEHARLEIANRNMSEARRYIGEALAMKPNYANAIFLLAQLQFLEGNVSEAVRSVEEAVLIEPNNEGLLFRLGLLKFNSEDYESAVLALSRAITLNPHFANAKYFLGLSYYHTQRISEAIVQFEDLEKSNPDNEEVKNILRNLRNGKNPFAGLGERALPEEREAPPFDE